MTILRSPLPFRGRAGGGAVPHSLMLNAKDRPRPFIPSSEGEGRKKTALFRWLAALLFVTLAACSSSERPADGGAGDDWASYGGANDEWHYSRLEEINADNVSRLGLAWYWDIPSPELAVSVPLAVDGVLYTATGYSKLRAFDVESGKLLWEYDPKVTGVRMRGTWGSRGLAYWKGHILVGTADGRLISVDAKTGREVWSAQTLPEGSSLFLSAAPLVFGDKVIVGNGGGDYGTNRGLVSTYDAATGKQLWRFWLVPGKPGTKDGDVSDPQMEVAAKTWNGEWWKWGGGGTVWNAMTYDPELKTIYLGTGNGSPWNQKVRSPGGGDNLYLCSIVALDAETGQYKWHYQTNPGETWDYNAAMDIQLATMEVDGKPRKVLMQAPKNGFFYVLDRRTGKLISAEKLGKVTWAEKIDLKTGRPVENPEARYPKGAAEFWPSPAGLHGWQAMAYSPQTKLVYIPTVKMAGFMADKGVDPKTYKLPQRYGLSTGLDYKGADVPPDAASGGLLAWDPVKQKKVWEKDFDGHYNGGVLTTAGGLVFHGNADGDLVAYAADTGEVLWSFPAQVGIVGAPISFKAGGKQYVALVAGFGGSAGIVGAASRKFGWDAINQERRVLVFALDGKARLPAPRKLAEAPFNAPDGLVKNPALFDKGDVLFAHTCFACHGLGAVGGGAAPDLRQSAVPSDATAFTQLLRGGALESAGMPKFADLSDAEIASLRHYILIRAQDAKGQR